MTTDHNQWHRGYQIGLRCSRDDVRGTVPATPIAGVMVAILISAQRNPSSAVQVGVQMSISLLPTLRQIAALRTSAVCIDRLRKHMKRMSPVAQILTMPTLTMTGAFRFYCRPALVPLVVEEIALAASMQGVALKNVRLTAFQCPADKIDPSLTPKHDYGRGTGHEKAKSPVIESRLGEMMLTHFGIGGPITLQMSLAVVDALEKGPVSVSIDLNRV